MIMTVVIRKKMGQKRKMQVYVVVLGYSGSAWRFATMEYGGQCVTMAGMKWIQTSSANNWVLTNKDSPVCP